MLDNLRPTYTRHRISSEMASTSCKRHAHFAVAALLSSSSLRTVHVGPDDIRFSFMAQAGDLPQDMSGSGSKTGQRGPLQIPEDDDILWRSSTWSGETQIKPQLPEEIPCPLYTDAKCYGGRFTYAQWRKFFAQERKKGMQQDASGQIIEVGRSQDFSWNAFIQFFRPEIWLLVLLHADAAALRAIASCCRGFQQITVPWRRRGTSSSGAELEKPEMPVVQLAARLRCGLPLAEELLHLPNQIQLPSTCRSWLDLLHQQEIEGTDTGRSSQFHPLVMHLLESVVAGAWLCLVHAGGMRDDVEEEVQVVEDFCQAVAVAEQWSEKAGHRFSGCWFQRAEHSIRAM